jgi:hypothetical protein
VTKEQLSKTVDLVLGDTWPKRRLVIYIALIFLAEVIAVCLWAAIQNGDAVLIGAIAGSAFLYGSMIIGSYVFGSIYDDSNKRKHLPKAGDGATPPEGGE